MKKKWKIVLGLLLALFIITGCERADKKNNEAILEEMDVVMMKEAESCGTALFANSEEAAQEQRSVLIQEGLWFSPSHLFLVEESPKAGYGFGTKNDGETVGRYFSGVLDGKPVESFYDSKVDYSDKAIKVQADEETGTVFYNWVIIE